MVKENDSNPVKESKEGKLDKFRANYEKLAKKHSLPSFDMLNNYFDIEELSSKSTDRFLRIIRRRITEKTSSYLRFMEVFLNPSQAPLFYMVLTKNMPDEGRKIINESYFDLGRIEIDHLRMELQDYDEKAESELIKDFCAIWSTVKKQMKVLVEIFDKQWKQKRSESREKTYLG